jgi:4a-hydroxytetrahydrobiopterin dehydratase
LTQEEERKFLAAFVPWEIMNTHEVDVPGGFKRELHRTYEFKTFEGAFEFMCEVKRRAIDPWDHHPRWQNSYNRIDVWLTTYNLGYKPSKKDVRLAREFEKVWREFDEGRR